MDSLTKNKVIFNYVIEDDGEDKDKNEGLPLYTIVIIIIVGMAVIVGAGFLIYKLACKKKKYPIDDNLSSSSCNNNRQKFHDISVKEKSSSRNIRNVKVIKFDYNNQ